MSTADELQALIARAHEKIKQRDEQIKHAKKGVDEAVERQRLRNDLRLLQMTISQKDSYLSDLRDDVSDIDNDRDIRCENFVEDGEEKPKAVQSAEVNIKECQEARCNVGIAKGEYVWKIEGMSWLVDALSQTFKSELVSAGYLGIKNHKIDFLYAPKKDASGLGSIWIRLVHREDECPAVRYKISVQNKEQAFEQLGAGSICLPDEKHSFSVICFGPDVDSQTGNFVKPARGIFGMSHEALLKSDFVLEDAMTIKFELELREKSDIQKIKPEEVEIPRATLCDDLSCLLKSGKCSDVRFVVDGETIRAHSQILAARSEVIDKILHSGMNESITKEIVVEDFDARTFKALLVFIYTDNCDCISSVLRESHCQGQGSEPNISDVDGVSIQSLQSLLAASQKYSLARLARWCEHHLCKRIAVENVCSLLCQAHLHDAKQLENVCLEFVRQNKAKVVVTETFISLSKDWPEVVLKMNMFEAGVSSNNAASAVELMRRAHALKRKRED